VNLKTCRAAAFAAVSFAFALPAFAATPVEEAQTLMSQGDYEGALKKLDRYLATSPTDAEARFARGLALVKLNKTPEAIKVFTDLTRDYPQLPEPYNNLAVLYAQQGDYEKARDALEAALATHPSYATAHENLGDIYAALAGASYNRALQLDQANQGIRYKLSLINQLGAQPVAGVAPPSTSKPAGPAVAAAAPAPAPTPLPPTAADNPAAAPVVDAVKAWAAAWASRDVDGYLASYSSGFQPEGGLSRSDWEAQRRTRISAAKKITVKVLSPLVSLPDETHARVKFVQDYTSDSFSDRTSKTLELINEGGSWKITSELAR
jgi:tetratricopeptide (TPR) repeat protein